MLELSALKSSSKSLHVLCIGAHCDDIEIGCGATLLELQRRRKKLRIDCVVLSGSDLRRAETRGAFNAFVSKPARGELLFADFADGFFPAQYADLKTHFESLKRLPKPDLILCHERDDRHQDHRIVNELTWSTFRDHLILEYEILKWDGGLQQPNVYVAVSAAQARAKAQKLRSAYRSQARKDWFTADAFLALMRLRGVECRSPSGFAEAFHGRKILLDI